MKCPYCNSKDISNNNIGLVCNDCGKEYFDKTNVVTLIDKLQQQDSGIIIGSLCGNFKCKESIEQCVACPLDTEEIFNETLAELKELVK